MGGDGMTRLTDAEFSDLLRRNPDVSVPDELRNAGALGGAAPAYRLTEAKPRHDAPTEHAEQVALFTWADAAQAQYPELANMFAIPNGAKVPYTVDSKGRTFSPERASLVTEGMRRGVPDIFLAVPRCKFHGLFVEMKRADHSNHPTPEQQVWIERLRQAGYMAVVCYGADDAMRTVTAYLQQDSRP